MEKQSGSRNKSREQRRIPSKLCVRCGKVLPLNAFYQNRGWAAQSFCDAWCKECGQTYCTGKETLREYCWYNNRGWADALYDVAVQKSQYL